MEIYFEGISSWGLGEGRPGREGDTSLGCWVVEKDEESSREREREKEKEKRTFQKGFFVCFLFCFVLRFRGKKVDGAFGTMAMIGMD